MIMFNSLKAVVHRIGMSYVRWLTAREYFQQQFFGVNERPIEFSFVFRQLVKFWPVKVLDVGTGATALPHLLRNCGFHVSAIDNIKDYWVGGMVNRHYHVINDDIRQTKIDSVFDVITCISVIEHIQEHRQAIRSMYSLLAPGGRLILTCPYSESQYVNNVYELPESGVKFRYPFVTQSFSRKEIENWLEDVPFSIVEQEYWRFFEGKFWTCGERVTPPQCVGVNDTHQISCLVLQKPK
jgi:SAM-dependent methyltransferase